MSRAAKILAIHEAADRPFTVQVDAHSLQPDTWMEHRGQMYSSRHRTARAAANKLAQIISGRSKWAKANPVAMPREDGRGTHGKYQIVGDDGVARSLTQHRSHYGIS